MTTFYPSPDIKTETFNSRYISQTKEAEPIMRNSRPETYVPLNNGFIDAVYHAYSRHHNLVIRPDDVWFAIMTQFAVHIEKNAEELREKFVSHSGKQELTVIIPGTFRNASYDLACLMFKEQISKNLRDKEIADWVTPDFSTSTETDRVIGSIILMASMKEYFSYGICLKCGLPSVTLLGTVQDWIKLYDKAKKIRDYDTSDNRMKIWYEMLEPVLDNFVRSAKGEPDLNWWNQCCTHVSRGSGPSYVSGWLTVFSVYDSANKWVANQMTYGSAKYPWPVIDQGLLAQGSVTVDVKVKDDDIVYETVLKAGSSGIICTDEKTLQPFASWSITDKQDIEKHEAEKKKRSPF